MRAQKYVLLPQEDAAAFAALETTILAELAPEGVLQTLLARRVAVAAWRWSAPTAWKPRCWSSAATRTPMPGSP